MTLKWEKVNSVDIASKKQRQILSCMGSKIAWDKDVKVINMGLNDKFPCNLYGNAMMTLKWYKDKTADNTLWRRSIYFKLF